MKKIDVINQLIPFIDGSGVCTSEESETSEEFINRIFGSEEKKAKGITGIFKKDTSFLYLYKDNANSIELHHPDMVVSDCCNNIVYLYELE